VENNPFDCRLLLFFREYDSLHIPIAPLEGLCLASYVFVNKTRSQKWFDAKGKLTPNVLQEHQLANSNKPSSCEQSLASPLIETPYCSVDKKTNLSWRVDADRSISIKFRLLKCCMEFHSLTLFALNAYGTRIYQELNPYFTKGSHF
jgi:hypothetical protein